MNGVVYAHEGLSDTELHVVRQIFNSGAAQVIYFYCTLMIATDVVCV